MEALRTRAAGAHQANGETTDMNGGDIELWLKVATRPARRIEKRERDLVVGMLTLDIPVGHARWTSDVGHGSVLMELQIRMEIGRCGGDARAVHAAEKLRLWMGGWLGLSRPIQRSSLCT